jgi:hypothetical protein
MPLAQQQQQQQLRCSPLMRLWHQQQPQQLEGCQLATAGVRCTKAPSLAAAAPLPFLAQTVALEHCRLVLLLLLLLRWRRLAVQQCGPRQWHQGCGLPATAIRCHTLHLPLGFQHHHQLHPSSPGCQEAAAAAHCPSRLLLLLLAPVSQPRQLRCWQLLS